MKRFFLLTLASAALLGASAAPVKTYEVKSPDGRLALVLTAGERLSFTVARDGETLVAPSEMALTLSTGEVLGESPRVRSARRRAVSETIDAPLYRQSRFDAAYNELDLRLRGDYGILARAYDDGVCYRFYTDIKRRKSDSRTYFLEKMQDKLNAKMRHDDELERMRR